MIRRWALILIGLGLCGVIALVVAKPRAMTGPGPLIPAHAPLDRDCFACHAPFGGPSAARCVSCHAVKDIGLRTTRGAPLTGRANRAGFHQSLVQPDCMACHSDHVGRGVGRPKATGGQTFSHDLLRAGVRERCVSCHRPPSDTVHRTSTTTCAQCHGQTRWKPATWDHAKVFALDGRHNAECGTCHLRGDTSRYTCFGCHAHQPGQIGEHHEGRGAEIAACARCHRGGSGEGGEGHWGREGGEGGEGREGGDDD